MRTMTKLMLALAMPAALLAGQSANAALIEEWAYENIAAFTANTGQGGTITGSAINNEVYTIGTPNPANPVAGSPTVLSWGVPANATNSQSRLRIVEPKVSGNAFTQINPVGDAGFVPDLTLFHDNFVIQSGVTLRTATLTAALLLEAVNPANGETHLLPGSFNIRFVETPNQPSNGICPSGDPTPCPDIFVLDQEGSSPLSFEFATIQDYTYTIELGLPNLQLISPTGCQQAGADAGCVGFVTREEDTSAFPVFFRITAVQNAVPEPGMLALLGLGLAGIGFGQIRRRK